MTKDASAIEQTELEKCVTVIIVNFNSAALLSDSIQSLLLSDWPIKIIIVDNNSQDDSITRVEHLYPHDQRILILRNATNTGFAFASNQGLSQAEGKYCLFLNPDCRVQPNTISEMYQLMEAYPDVAMSGPLIVNPDGSEQRGCRRAIPTPWRSFVLAFGLSRFIPRQSRFNDFLLHEDPLPDQAVDVEAISGAFMFVRRETIKEVGPLDDGYFLHCEDLDWCMRFRQKNWRILFNPKVVVTHVKGGCSESREIFVLWHMHKGMLRFYKKFFKEDYPGPLMWMVSISVWLRFFCLAIYQLLRRLYKKICTLLGKKKHNPADHLTELKPLNNAQKTNDSAELLITGASSLIGQFLLPRLETSNYKLHACSRSKLKLQGWHTYNNSFENTQPPIQQAEVLIHLGPIWVLNDLIDSFVTLGGKRIIAFSSTSRFSKVDSSNESERQIAHSLIQAEQEVTETCQQKHIDLTIFRPTLIYAAGRDKNISSISKFIQRFSFFPLVGEGAGLRQPVHADDLAQACLLVLENKKTYQKNYNLSGGETLNYRKMVERIFIGLEKKPRFLSIPLGTFRALIHAATWLPAYAHLSADMADRINQDLCFDNSEAIDDFGYQARPFYPQKADLPADN